jgi:hypothetical protein
MTSYRKTAPGLTIASVVNAGRGRPLTRWLAHFRRPGYGHSRAVIPDYGVPRAAFRAFPKQYFHEKGHRHATRLRPAAASGNFTIPA